MKHYLLILKQLSMLTCVLASVAYGEEGFKLNLSPYALKTLSSMSTTGPVDCSKDYLGSGLKVTNFAFSAINVGNITACSNIKSDIAERYSEENCRLTIACSQTKLNKDNPSILTLFAIPRFISEDFVSMNIQQSIGKMEKIDRLRKYAESKYGANNVGTCSPRFKNSEPTTACDTALMDNGFNRLQNKCSPVLTYCYNNQVDPKKDYKTFLENRKAEPEPGSAIISFINNKTDVAVKDALSTEDELLNNLILISETKDRSDIKLQSMFAFIKEFKKQGKLDPT